MGQMVAGVEATGTWYRLWQGTGEVCKRMISENPSKGMTRVIIVRLFADAEESVVVRKFL